MLKKEHARKLFGPFPLPAGNPLKNWQIDEAFIAQALAQAEKVDIVSFDIFDTALTRLLNSPIDVFAEVERRLLQVYGRKVKGFAMAREQAERIARQKNPQAEDITFAQIYAELPTLLPDFSEYKIAAEVERFVEKQLLFAVPDILELTCQLNARHKPWIFVSDMYLPSKFLAEVLQDNSYQGWQSLHVSAEIGATKASGNIWQALFPTLHDAKILHIGDDFHADIAMPKQKGITTLVYRRVVSERRVGAKLDPHLLPVSRLKRHLDLQDAAQNIREKTPEQQWYRLGQIMGGMTLACFVQWLAERVQLHQIERLYFCARDGYLMQRAWETAGMAARGTVEAHYLHISRAALNIIAGLGQSTAKQIDYEFADFLASTDGRVSISHAIARAGLHEAKALQAEALEMFGSLDTLLFWPDTQPRFIALLQKHSHEIFTCLQHQHKEHLQAALQYFRQMELFDKKRKAIVDMGWHATMQTSLNSLLKKYSASNGIGGFYYGLWPAAKGNRYAAGLMESCFASDFAALNTQCELWQAIAPLELLHSTAEGTTRYYAFTAEDKAEPVQAESQQTHNQEYIRQFQAGALDSVQKLFHENSLPITLSDIGNKEVLAALGIYILSPTSEELQLFMSLEHCATFDHDSNMSLITTKMPENIEEVGLVLRYSYWMIGQMRYWWLHADAQQRQFLHEFIQAHMSYFPPLVLQQFS